MQPPVVHHCSTSLESSRDAFAQVEVHRIGLEFAQHCLRIVVVICCLVFPETVLQAFSLLGANTNGAILTQRRKMLRQKERQLHSAPKIGPFSHAINPATTCFHRRTELSHWLAAGEHRFFLHCVQKSWHSFPSHQAQHPSTKSSSHVRVCVVHRTPLTHRFKMAASKCVSLFLFTKFGRITFEIYFNRPNFPGLPKHC